MINIIFLGDWNQVNTSGECGQNIKISLGSSTVNIVKWTSSAASKYTKYIYEVPVLEPFVSIVDEEVKPNTNTYVLTVNGAYGQIRFEFDGKVTSEENGTTIWNSIAVKNKGIQLYDTPTTGIVNDTVIGTMTKKGTKIGVKFEFSKLNHDYVKGLADRAGLTIVENKDTYIILEVPITSMIVEIRTSPDAYGTIEEGNNSVTVVVASPGEYGGNIGEKSFTLTGIKGDSIPESGITVTSDIYTVDEENKIIRGISPETSIQKFYENIEIEPEEIEKHIEESDEEVEDKNIATKMELVIEQEGEEKVRYKLIVKGDVNPNGKIDIRDIIAIATNIVTNNLTEEQKIAGDLNEDGKVNIKDIIIIAKVIAGITPVEEI